MLEDRYYMRQRPLAAHRSATVTLVVANILAFILTSVLYQFTSFPVDRLALGLEGLKHGYVWQLVTYQFMHAGMIHLLVNCWAIYVFGQAVEDALGRKSFLLLYFSSGALGGLVQVLAGLLLRGPFAAQVVGASAAGFGLAAAFAMLFPDRVLLLFFIVPLRARYILLGSAALALYGMLFPGDGIAHAAHLGGLLTGVIFIRYNLHWQWPGRATGLGRVRARASRRLVKVQAGGPGLWPRPKNPVAEDLPPEEFLSREVDPILDKISAHGIQSLTERERLILETARARMAKR